MIRLATMLAVIATILTPGPTQARDWNYDPEVSWYGPGFYGKRTACGHAYTKTILGVAHRDLPCGTLVEFRHQGRSVAVPVIDRGPYVAGRQWDLSGGLCVLLDHCFTGPIEWRFAGPGVTPPPTTTAPWSPSGRVFHIPF